MLNMMDFLSKRIIPRQEELKRQLHMQDEGHSIWTKTPSKKEISKGCQSCKTGTWMCVYVGNKCNATCPYCTQGSREEKEKKNDQANATRYMLIDQLKSLIAEQSTIVTGISYSGGEPLMYLPKIREIAGYVSNNFPHIYQWMYTNGLLLTEDQLKQLRDVNVQEIRFHLGASDFSHDVIEKMKLASKYIKYINVETPAVQSAKEHLIEKGKLQLLADMGVNQINLSELYITGEFNKRFIGSAETYLYTSPVLTVVSPTYSREITYDIMDYAIKRNIDMMINDCSNDAKYWQQVMCRKTNIPIRC